MPALVLRHRVRQLCPRMALNLHYVRIFAAVAEARSISRAASVVRISQPAVSKAISLLERQVGMPLLERQRRGVLLTPAGEALYAQARTILDAERSAEEELASLRGLETGTLRVGASTTIATYLLPELLATFHRAHPAIDLRVTSRNTREIARLLLARELDVALVEGPVHEARIQTRDWREEELVVIVAPGHPLAARRRVTAADLAGELHIIREAGSGTREVVEAALRRHAAVPRRTLEVGGTEAIKQTVAAGLGLAIVSRAAAADQLALGTLRELRVQGMALRRRLTQLLLPGRRVSAAATAFEALLR